MAAAPKPETDLQAQKCLISLLFARDRLPHPADIFALVDTQGGFFIAHDLRMDSDPATALELLTAGLTFDCLWPEAAVAVPIPQCTGRFDVPEGLDLRALRPLHLMTGAHLSAGYAALPIAQEAIVLAARFCTLPRFAAAVWHPGRALIGPAYLVSIAASWGDGGVFPPRGLIGLGRAADGAMQSEGLAFFTGQEMRIEAELLDEAAMAEKIAARLIDRLVGGGRVTAAQDIAGPDGRMLRIVPSSNGRVVRVWGG